MDISRQQMAQRHTSSAVTLAAAPSATVGTADGGSAVPKAVTARWELPGGGQRSGTVNVAPGTAAGTTVPVWLDQNGNVAAAPLRPGDALAMALAVGMLAWGIAAIGVASLVAAARRILGRARAHRWDREWERFGRRQSPHFGES
ncbi:hypothetical protein HFP15_24455 [Amycolatopsis sp. K13G38]|uniref:Transmembrane protein n=1 Tax=Amycolatopsis acididurans TaxID=2724524 RepID=A0ABX1J9R6_9PSEU|nr:hypothetical protein [Amycolatopsis acididurans]NKQ56036.1 hypothetical protein [Amycolatopsis acididurans]